MIAWFIVVILGLFALWALSSVVVGAMSLNLELIKSRSAKAASRGALIAGTKGFNFPVVGESRYQEALSGIVGGHSREGHSHECVASLVPEPSNIYDPKAIQVAINGHPVGYIPADETTRLHAAFERHGPLRCRARIDGGWRTNQHDVGDFGVKLAIPKRGAITLA